MRLKISLVLLLASFPLFADRIVFNNQSSIECEIQSIGRNTVTAKVGDSIKEYSKSDVSGVIYKNKFLSKEDWKDSEFHKNTFDNSNKPKESSANPPVANRVSNKNSNDTPISNQTTTECCNKFLDKLEELEKKREDTYQKNIDQLLKQQADGNQKLIDKIDAIENRREDTYRKNTDLVRDELEFLKKERERLEKERALDNEFKEQVNKRLTELEIRNRRLEKYLAMDEQMVDYYGRKRSPWDLVWRSAVFPGWGHRYARQEYTGNTYTTSILILLGIGYYFNKQVDIVKKGVQDKAATDLISKSMLYKGYGSFSDASLVQSYGSYMASINTLNSQKQLGQTMMNLALGIYVVQIVHSYFTGVEWAKSSPKDYSRQELMKPWGGLNMQTYPRPIASHNNTNKLETYSEIDYTVQF